jgi:cold shock protein
VVHISRRQRYDELDDDAKRAGRRPAAPRYRRPSDKAEALFSKAPDGRIAPATEEEMAPRTGKVKWFNARNGFGFVTFEDGVDAFLPARALRGEDAPTGATISVRVAESQKGLEVIEVVGEIDLSTAKEPAGTRTSRGDLSEPQWTAEGTMDPKDWRATYGFVTTDAGDRVFVSGSVIGACGYPIDRILGRRVEIGVVRTDRGPAAAKIKVAE